MYCKNCKQHYRYDDLVVLDEWNSILHETCYKELTHFKINDRGTYREIVEKYDFFEEFRY